MPRNIKINFRRANQGEASDGSTFFIQVPDRSDLEDVDKAVIAISDALATTAGDGVDAPEWEWEDWGQEVPDCPFLPMPGHRLEEISLNVPIPKYCFGSIVRLIPDESDSFYPGTRGVIVAAFACDDVPGTEPYVSYSVQVMDNPPAEGDRHAPGFAFDDPWVVDVYESQVCDDPWVVDPHESQVPVTEGA